jgi:hypothetical protein
VPADDVLGNLDGGLALTAASFKEVRTMSHRIDRMLEDKAWCWTLHEYDRDTPFCRSIRIGAAEYRQKVRALAIPTRGRGNPALAALDDPSVT